MRLPLQVRAESGNGNGNGSGEYDYDLFTIGAGSGGVRASRVAAATYGAKVAVCEMPFNPIASDNEGGAGGTCVLRGCVPKKLFVYCSSFAEAMQDAEGFGWQIPGGASSATVDWASFLAKKNAELQRLNGVYGNILKNSGVEFIEGRGTIMDAHTVEVAGKRYTARNILVATGGRAHVPEGLPGVEHCIISDEALELAELPKSIVIVGGGYIAVEFAGIFARLGVETHVVYRQDLPLRGFDEECREFVAEQYAEVGRLRLHPGQSPTAVVKNDDGSLTMTMKDKQGNESSVTTAVVMMATGRSPNTRNLGLEQAGVELNKRGAITVDQYSRTNVPSIWAVGDVTDRMNLTPVALMEGMALCKTMFGNEPTAPQYDAIATAVFSNPELSTCGLTEQEAVEKYGDVDVYTSKFRPMKNTISGNPGRTLMKIIVDAATDRVLGFHMVGPDSAEIMQGLALAVKYGMRKQELDQVVGIHPSAAEEFVTMRSVTRQVRNKVPAAAAA